jgi:hypothetical protein
MKMDNQNNQNPYQFQPPTYTQYGTPPLPETPQRSPISTTRVLRNVFFSLLAVVLAFWQNTNEKVWISAVIFGVYWAWSMFSAFKYKLRECIPLIIVWNFATFVNVLNCIYYTSESVMNLFSIYGLVISLYGNKFLAPLTFFSFNMGANETVFGIVGWSVVMTLMSVAVLGIICRKLIIKNKFKN